MKTKIKRVTRKSFIIFLSMITMISSLGIGSFVTADAYDAHFGFRGDDTSWSSSTAINNGTGMSNDEWFAYIYMTKNNSFALHNGTNQYGPSSNGSKFKTREDDSSSGETAGYNGTNSWKYDSATQLVKVCVAESSNREWYPYVWLHAAELYVVGASGLCGANWTHGTAADKMTLSSGKYTLTKTVPTAGTYQFKIGDGVSWNSYNPLGSNQSVTTSHNNDQVKITFDPSNNSVTSQVIHQNYTVTLNTDGGTINSGNVTSYTCGTGATLPTNVTKSGYVFDGWYTAASGGTKVTSISSSDYGNKTYYAHWTRKTYTVTYKPGTNGTGSQTTDTKTHGTALPLRGAIFTRTGYTQTGWSTTDGGSKTYDTGGSYTTDAAATFYPYWTKNDYSITVANGTGTNNTMYTFTGTTTAHYNEQASFTLNATSGYEILSVVVTDSNDNVITHSGPATGGVYTIAAADMPASDLVVTVNAQSTATPELRVNYTGASGAATLLSTASGSATTSTRQNVTITFTNQDQIPNNTSYSVTYTKDGGASQNLTSGTTSSSGGEVTVRAAATLDAGTYVYTISAGGFSSSVTVVVNQSRNLTVPAVANTTVSGSYVNEFGVSSSFSSTGTYYCNNNTAYAVTYSIANTALYTFSSSDNNETTSAQTGTISSNLTLTTPTVYEKKYTLTVNQKLGDRAATQVETKTVQTVTKSTVTAPSNTGYVITGWKVTSGTVYVNTTSYSSGSTISTAGNLSNITIRGNATIQANYDETKHNVTLTDATHNASTITNAIGIYTPYTVTAAAKPGYSFDHWDITGTSVVHGSGSSTTSASISITAQSNVTLVAHYTEDLHTVTVEPQKVNTVAIGRVTPDSGTAGIDTSFSATATAKTGYEFTGWEAVTGLTYSASSSAKTLINAEADGKTAKAKFKPTIIYLDTSDSTYHWSKDSAVIKAKFGSGSYTAMTKVPGEADVWKITIPSGVTLGTTKIQFQRCNPSNGTEWNATGEYTTPTEKNIYKITAWDTAAIQNTPYFPPVTHKVSFTADAGIASISVKIGSGSSQSYTSGTELTVDTTKNVVFTVTYNTGYTYNSSSNITKTSNTVFTLTGDGTETDVAATLTSKMIDYELTASVSPNYGTLKFYSDSNCTTEIPTAHYNTAVYAKYTPPTDYYAVDNITCTSGSATRTSFTGNIAVFTMGASNATIRATVKAATPTFGDCPDMSGVLANESFTYTGTNLATLSGGSTTVTYSFNGSAYQSSNTFTAPTTAGTYNLIIKASNSPEGISTAAVATKTVHINVTYRESTVKYYVDMHDNNMSGKTVTVSVVTDSEGNTVKTDSNNHSCTATLIQQESSTVYGATINTPVTKSGANYNNLYFKVTYDGHSTVHTLSTQQISSYIYGSGVQDPQIWLEAVNESSQTLSVSNSTHSEPTIASGYRRIYIAKPYSWGENNTETSWNNIGIYYWGNNPNDIGWNNGIHMNYLGYDGTGSSGLKYYYADIPKTITQGGTSYKVHSIIFQGWGANTTAGSYTKAQTGNIENISDTANYFVLSKSNNSYVGTAGDDVVVPGYTRYVSEVKLNKTESSTVNLTPKYTGKSVSFSSSNNSVVNVGSSTGIITPATSGTATITVSVYGTIGAKLTGGKSNGADKLTYTVPITVKDPTKYEGFNIMSFKSVEYLVNIPQQNSNQPGYFDMSGIQTSISGIAGADQSSNSAIIIPVTTVNVPSTSSNQCIAFKVKYAYSDALDTHTYNDGQSDYAVQIEASVTTKSIRASGTQRYGLNNWEVFKDSISEGAPAYTIDRSISSAVETATTSGISFNYDTADTYSAIFAQYNYVDVTFVYDYYEYNPEVVNGKINYPYDAAYAGNEDSSNTNFAASHTQKTHTESNYELRGYTAETITPSDLVTPATKAIGVVPTNNYYDYTIDASTIPSAGIERHQSTFTATVYVHLKHTVKNYSVYVNGTQFGSSFTYQQYAEPTVNTSSKWYARKSNAQNEENGPLLATGTSYKFRVKGNTYLFTEAGSVSDADFNRSEVAFSHYGITHRDNSSNQNVEYLLQNFYIADFFDKNKVLNADNNNLPYEDAEFVGGGVIYYSMKDGSPNQNAVDTGYVTEQGLASEGDIEYLLTSKIMENYHSDVADSIGEEDAKKLAYGTEIPVQKNVENGINTGLFYRYLPLYTYTTDASGNPSIDQTTGNYVKNLNDNVFRYSNALQSYQYTYASGNENKVTNSGKNMRLYSYYVYSYTDYDKETDVPETKYKIILSDKYADASTYWDGTN